MTQSYAANCQEARKYFGQAFQMKHQPGDTKVLLEKERLYRKALKLCPNYPAAHNNLGDVYENLGRYAEAIEEYKKAKELRSDFPHPYFGLGDVYFKSGKYDEATKWYRKGLAIEPGDKVSQENIREARALLNNKVVPQREIVKVLGRITIRGPGDAIKLGFSDALLPFEYNRFDIRGDAKPQLIELGKALTTPELSMYVFEIGGHTDIRGSEAYNLKLSLRRAEAVRNYLVQNFRIGEERLKVKGFGEYRLIAQGNDEASHAMNRRVVIERLGSVGKVFKGGVPVIKEARLSLDVGFLYQDGKGSRRLHIRSDGKTVLRTGQNPYQIFFRPHQACYVYVLQKDSAGKWYLLSPPKGSDLNINPVKRGKDYWVPQFDQGFSLDETKGEETIYLLASLWEIADLESTESKLEEVVVPITRSFQTRGLSYIGKPETGPHPGGDTQYESAIKKIAGSGGFLHAISFIHE